MDDLLLLSFVVFFNTVSAVLLITLLIKSYIKEREEIYELFLKTQKRKVAFYYEESFKRCIMFPRIRKMSNFIQLILWKCGVAIHNAFTDECTPDFNCCSKTFGRKAFIKIRRNNKKC